MKRQRTGPCGSKETMLQCRCHICLRSPMPEDGPTSTESRSASDRPSGSANSLEKQATRVRRQEDRGRKWLDGNRWRRHGERTVRQGRREHAQLTREHRPRRAPDRQRTSKSRGWNYGRLFDGAHVGIRARSTVRQPVHRRRGGTRPMCRRATVESTRDS